MSVMACDRVGCRSVMCDRLILEGRKYICNDCYAELLRDRSRWPSRMTATELGKCIETFMGTRPGSLLALEGEELDREFDRLTGGGEGVNT